MGEYPTGKHLAERFYPSFLHACSIFNAEIAYARERYSANQNRKDGEECSARFSLVVALFSAVHCGGIQ